MTLIYLQAGESTPANVRLRDPTTAPSAGAVIFGWQSDDAPLARKLRGGVEAYSPPVPPAAAPSVALALDEALQPRARRQRALDADSVIFPVAVSAAPTAMAWGSDAIAQPPRRRLGDDAWASQRPITIAPLSAWGFAVLGSNLTSRPREVRSRFV